MHHTPAIPAFILCILLHSLVGAQSVLYSSTVTNDVNTRFEVIGKAGDFYWLYKIKKNYKYKNGFTSFAGEERSFEVFDERLQSVKQIPTPLPDSVLKQYLVPQKACFDQLVFKKSLNKTAVVVNRYAPDGEGALRTARLFDYPSAIDLEDVIVTRSPDRSKILLLGFVRDTNLAPDIYARVYTRDWELLRETIYKQGNLVQPFIQYDRTSYLLESSDVSPVKITNSGDWLMVAPARGKNGYVLCRFNNDSSLAQVDIQQPLTSGIEYCSLSIEEAKDAYVGILENVTATDKRLRMVQYSLAQNRLVHDTAYSFQLPHSFKNYEYQFEEEFIQIPGKGFMYLKEYGRRYFVDNEGDQILLDNEQAYPAYANHPAKLKWNKNEYTRNRDFPETKKRFERGDLGVKYFPFHPADSSWGGLIHVDQDTELRYADLSYACVPSKDKIVFLYNSLAKNAHKVSSSTVLDHKGESVDDGVVFWRPANVLNFQKARLVQPGEVVVPFDRHIFQGFAIIRF